MPVQAKSQPNRTRFFLLVCVLAAGSIWLGLSQENRIARPRANYPRRAVMVCWPAMPMIPTRQRTRARRRGM